MFFKITVSYLVLVSVVTLLLFGTDKRKARLHRPRIAETKLFLFAIIGGSIGALSGMYLFRHKTRHLKFRIGLPLILLLQTAIMSFLVLYF